MFDPLDHDYPIDDAELDDILDTAADRCIDSKRLTLYDVAMLAGPLAVIVPMAFGLEWLLNALGFGTPWWIIMPTGMVPYALVALFGYRRRFRREVIAELRARGHNVCPACGYPREGLDDAAPCPECGYFLPAQAVGE